MPKVTKVKYVTKELPAEDYDLLWENQQIAKTSYTELVNQGNNLYDVRQSSGKTCPVSTAATFRRTAWIKRADFLIVQPTKEGPPVTVEIHRILFPYQVKHIRDQGMW
ncbi:hypothetical protein HPB50_015451 [Hyalomma asiaticum]|uniref:Uncharacterized protein n=1 Tax=Hyalomma asiaticum TaxID=266040 RepID=A0ACB7T0R1_HYAAI|nr:hypothetical protein HPB50_015451 [Hyalomma asiaticum]